MSVLACVGVVTGVAPAHASEISVRSPNILFIVTDDQRLAGTVDLLNPTGGYWMGGLNNWFRETGTTFQDGYVPNPLCCPSRASIFTGRYPHNHGVQTDQEGTSLGTTETGATAGQQPTTLQAYLRSANYTTGIVGKYLNGWDINNAPPFFDYYAIFDPGYGRSHECSSCTLNVNVVGGTPHAVSEYSTNWVNNRALEFIDAHADDANPWFLTVNPYAPHLTIVHRDGDPPGSRPAEIAQTDPDTAGPSTVPDDGYTLTHPTQSYFEPDLSDKPDWLRPGSVAGDETKLSTEQLVVDARRSQLLSLITVDNMIRAIMRRLQAHPGVIQDTLAVFVSDNGYMWGEHKLGPPRLPRDLAPGIHGIPGKGQPYPESIKVPFFMRWQNAPAGTRFELPTGSGPAGVDRRPVSTVDLAATVLDAVNATRSTPIVPDPTYPLDGRSLFDRTWLRTRILTEFWRFDDNNTTVPPWASDRYFRLYQNQDPTVTGSPACASNSLLGPDHEYLNIACPLYQYDFQFNEYYRYVNEAGCKGVPPVAADCAPNYDLPPIFREYYDGNPKHTTTYDAQETDNAYGPDGYPGRNPATGMNDDRSIPNQLPIDYLANQLARDRTCKGRGSGPFAPCP